MCTHSHIRIRKRTRALTHGGWVDGCGWVGGRVRTRARVCVCVCVCVCARARARACAYVCVYAGASASTRALLCIRSCLCYAFSPPRPKRTLRTHSLNMNISIFQTRATHTNHSSFLVCFLQALMTLLDVLNITYVTSNVTTPIGEQRSVAKREATRFRQMANQGSQLCLVASLAAGNVSPVPVIFTVFFMRIILSLDVRIW